MNRRGSAQPDERRSFIVIMRIADSLHMSSRAAWALRLDTVSSTCIFVPLIHCAQKSKQLLESHLSVTRERRAHERRYGTRGKVMHEEG